MITSSRIEHGLFLAAGAFSAFTFSWIVTCIFNNGDAFPQGAAIPLLPSLLLVPLGTTWFMRRRGATRNRTVVVILTLAALTFWLLVPTGWWAVGPPH
jgi:hypothetical protein